MGNYQYDQTPFNSEENQEFSSPNAYTQRNLFDILLIQLEIRLYLPISDLFGFKRTSVWFQINRKMVNTI